MLVSKIILTVFYNIMQGDILHIYVLRYLHVSHSVLQKYQNKSYFYLMHTEFVFLADTYE